jgi:hypothetical protein
VEVKKTRKLYQQQRKKLAEHIDLELDKVNVEKYLITLTRRSLDLPGKSLGRKDITHLKEQRAFSPFTLIGEIALYLQMSPIDIKMIMKTADESLEKICERVNEHNELLYDEVIPRLFKEIFDIKEFTHDEEVSLELVKDPMPTGSDCYHVKYKEGLLASNIFEEYQAYRNKSFNVDNYCFDSEPELMMFRNLLHDERILKVWFTGMLTAGQTEFVINYIDPESNTVRSYYPDFLIQKKDGSYIIIEVKGDHMIDNAVVQAKKEYARQIAAASAMDYIIVPGTKCSERLMITE